MPSPHRTLTLDDLRAHVHAEVFRAHCDGDVGIELEWLTIRRDDPSQRPTLAELEVLVASLTDLPHSSRISIEPGGQLEVSSPPLAGVGAACEAAADDLYHLDLACRAAGLDLIAMGRDPLRAPERLILADRYVAMNVHFDAADHHGRTMMTNTASIQLNLGLGHGPDDIERRWRMAHRLGPVLLAAFANSPLAEGRATGWASSRMQTWWGIDPTRTAPVEGGDPAEAWARYALGAHVMLIHDAEGRCIPMTERMTFGDWMEHGHELGWPTVDDLAYHLTTLFPPVRPRGWLELRMFDSLPTPYWHVAVAVTAALLDDDALHDDLVAATDRVDQLWVEASRDALGDPRLAAAADRCLALAARSLGDRGADDATLALTDDFRRRFVGRGRTPADDRLDAFHRDGTLFPAAESPIPYADLEAAWR